MLHRHPAALSKGLLAVRAQGRAPEKPTNVDGLIAAFENFKATYDARHDKLREALESMNLSAALGGLPSATVADPEYTAQFGTFVRTGHGEQAIQAAQRTGNRGEIIAAMSVGSEPDGGYLAPTEWDRKIQQAQKATSPMRRLATIQTTTVGAYSTIWNDDQWGSGWVGETAARPVTNTPQLSTVVFGHGEVYANAAISQRLLDDAQFDLEGWLAGSVETEFNRQEGIAFLSGDGVNKPFGLLQYAPGGAAEARHPGGALAVDNSGGTTANLTYDGLTDFIYKLPAPYRQGACWLMNSTTAAELSKMKDLAAFPIWREGMVQGQPSMLMGYPVEIDEGMPAPVSGNTPIAFGNFKMGYLINDRIGVRILRDPYTNKPFVMFYVTKRVGGGVLDPNAIRLLRIAAA